MTVSPPFATQAQALLAQRRNAEAVALAERGAAAGDAPSHLLLATWYLRGPPTPKPRDLIAARHHLRHAVSIGHVDAALMEIALTANGSGGAADWRGALDLLRQAARNDHIAKAQLDLVSAMIIDDHGRPTRAINGIARSDRPEVRHYRGFCTPAECRHIATTAAPWLAPAVVVDASGRTIAHPVRTSDNALIGPAQEDLVIAAINRRIASASATAYDAGEPLAVLRYRPGQQYRLHSDALPGVDNQRVKTFIIYLNSGFAGGETEFPKLNLRFAPQAGDAIEFTNLLQSGAPDPLAWHAGLPVTRGEKWIATRWIRRDPHNPWAAP